MSHSFIQRLQLEEAHRLDAEYFMPEFLDIATHLGKISSLPLEHFGKVVASAFYPAAAEFYSTRGLPFIRVVDVVNYPIIDGTQPIERIPEEFVKRSNGLTNLEAGDIVISKVGTPCYASIIADSLGEVTLTRTVLGIKKIHGIDNFYLLAFLRSKYGFYQLMREREQQIQLQLTLDRVRNIRIFLPSEDEQKKVADEVLDSYKTKQKAEELYSQAEELLLEELGLNDAKFEESLAHAVKFSDIKTKERMDADYFQPKYEKLIGQVILNGGRPLGGIASVKKGIEPGAEAYQDEGRLFIRVSSISKQGITDKDQKYLNEELYKKLKENYQPRVDDILLTKDASPGIAYALKEPIEGIISGGVLRLKLHVDIDPEYIALCINSLIGQMQVDRDAGGSIISHWKPEQVKNMLIPILPKKTQQKIANLVRQSHESRKKSKELLESAKRKVEELIEKGGAA